MRKTKIICTLGPATDNPDVLRQLMLSGMNVARINMSHQSHKDHKARIDMVKALREELRLPIAILIDTKGPEIRLGAFKEPKVELRAGDSFTLTTEPVEGDSTIASISFAGLPADVRKGGHILIDDGLIDMEVQATTATTITCTVINGGIGLIRMLEIGIVCQDKAFRDRHGDLTKLVIRLRIVHANGIINAAVIARQIDAALLESSIDGNKAVLVLAGCNNHVLAVHDDGIADGQLRNIHHVVDIVIINRQGDLRLAVFFGDVLRAEACCDGHVGQRVQVQTFRQRLDALCFLRALLRVFRLFRIGRRRGCFRRNVLLCIRIYLLGCAGAQGQHRKGQQNC